MKQETINVFVKGDNDEHEMDILNNLCGECFVYDNE